MDMNTPVGMEANAAYAERRARLMQQMRQAGGGVAILPTAPEALRNSDVEYPYRHDSYFYYLCGFMEPEAVLVLVAPADGSAGRTLLFCREKNPEREIWDGFRYGPQGAVAAFGLDAGFDIAALDAEMPKLLADAPGLFCAIGRDAAFDARLRGWLAAVRAQARAGVSAPAVMHEVRAFLDDMRLFKDAGEIGIMRRAAQISGAAHARAMRHSRPGKTEYQIEAELLHEFRHAGSDFPAYTSIVATGANACVLHYRAGAAVLQDGDLVLIDAGCEFEGYASDITRTYPANGVFTPAQRRLYEIVFEAQKAAIAAARPGALFSDGHDAAVRILAQGMLDTGLLARDKVGNVGDVIANGHYRQFYMHRTGHWLGMDVHDTGDYREPAGRTPGAARAGSGAQRPPRRLGPGMVLTVEPGIYVRPAEGVPQEYWNIGIRIEDDVAITPEGREVLSISAPKTIDEIEAVMREGGARA